MKIMKNGIGNMMNTEIERKFLVDDLSLLMKDAEISETANENMISQYYINDEVRLRVECFEDEQGFWKEEFNLTIKLGKSFMRQEYEYQIPNEEGKFLRLDLQKANKNFIYKKRYLFEFKNIVYELDVFEGKNKGLSILEIELDNKDDDRFLSRLPRGIGKEVTNDQKYYNSNLAKYSYLELISRCEDCRDNGCLCCRGEDGTCSMFIPKISK